MSPQIASESAKLVGVVLYLAVLVYIGVLASRRMKNVRDYYAGGKQMGFWAVAFSARATGESAWLLLGLTGMGAAIGYQAFWVVVGEVLGVSASWLLLSKRFKRLTDRYDSLTVPDYLESRFRDRGHALRVVSAAALVAYVTIYVSAQYHATGDAFEAFLEPGPLLRQVMPGWADEWNYYLGIAIGFTVVLAYIVSGGFVAVVWSDVFQGILMVVGLTALPVVGVIAAGGWGEVVGGLAVQTEAARAIDPTQPDLLAFSLGGDAFAIAGTVSLLLIGLGYLGSPQIFVRFIALRSDSELGRGAAVAIGWTLFADVGAVLTGMIGRHLLVSPGATVESALGNGAEEVLPSLVASTMPALFVGLYIAIVLSAIMSTVDSLLVVASSAVVRDWFQKIHAPQTPDDALMGISRKTTFALASIALAITLVVAVVNEDRTVFSYVLFAWSGIAATFCPVVILSLFWPRMTARGALAAMLVGLVSVPIFKFVAPGFAAPLGPFFASLGELPPSFLAALIAGIGVSLQDKRGLTELRGVQAELDDAGA